jgi:hypothetical protein
LEIYKAVFFFLLLLNPNGHMEAKWEGTARGTETSGREN